MRGARGLALALCLQIVAANDACPGNGKKPKREDRLTRLAAHYNSERCITSMAWRDFDFRTGRRRAFCGGLPGDMPGDQGLPILFVPRRSSGQALPPVQGRHSRHSRPEMLQFGRTRGRPHAPRMLLGPQVLPAGRLGHEARWQTEADYLVSRAARNITLFSLLPNSPAAPILCSFAASSSRGRRA